MTRVLFLVLLLPLAASCVNADETKILGIYLGMPFEDAVQEMKDRGIFERTAWRGNIALSEDRNCSNQFMIKFDDDVESCFSVAAEASMFEKDQDSRFWEVSEITFDQGLGEAIYIESWLDRMTEHFGEMRKYHIHENKVQNHEEHHFISILSGDEERVNDLEDRDPFHRDIIEEMKLNGCGESLKYVDVRAFVEQDMVFGYRVKMYDLQISCKESMAIDNYKREESSDAKEQIDFS